MKKIVLESLSKFSVIEADKPQIESPEDVLVKISAVGVCGSDIHYFRTGRIGDQVINYPFTPGHEFSGVIEAVGEKVERLNVGERIAVDPAISCKTCEQCRQGRYHTCTNLKFMGNPAELEGGLQEYVVVSADFCFLLDEAISNTEGVIIEPFTIALHALSFNTGKDNFAILGSGPIGLCTLIGLNFHFPNAKKYVTDKIDQRLSYARSKGAEWTGNPDKEDVVASIMQENPGGVDTVFECCGEQEAIDQAIEILKPGGQLILLGIPEVDRISFDINEMRRREISFYNVRRQNEKYDEAFKILRDENTDFSGFISHTLKPEQIQEAYEMVAGYKDGVIKAIISFD